MKLNKGDVIQVINEFEAERISGSKADSDGDFMKECSLLCRSELGQQYTVKSFDTRDSFVDVESTDGSHKCIAIWGIKNIDRASDNPEIITKTVKMHLSDGKESERLFQIAIDFGSAGNISMSQALMKLWNNELKGE